jgi:malonate-semialdehyde dehydrogenase (acetylating)/methylmalonate-semialdehyde dehydrogenase
MTEIYEPFKKRFIDGAKQLKVGYGLDEDTDVGPVVTKESWEKLHADIEKGVDEGAKLLLDGRDVTVEGFPHGHWLGPTIFEVDDMKGMYIFEEEVFGPVVCLQKVESMDEAITLINSGKYGHSAVIYTEMGEWAQRFSKEVDVGQIGINIGTPAPIGFYPLGGTKQSKFGALRARGRQAIDFYTDQKIVVTRWLGAREAFEKTWMENI